MEPRPEEALEMLRGVKARYEAHHGVMIADEALAAAVKLSVAWLPDRHLPDKALDLLDEACSRARIPTISKPADSAWRGWCRHCTHGGGSAGGVEGDFG